MSYSLSSLKGATEEIILGSIMGLIKADTKSLDNGSYDPHTIYALLPYKYASKCIKC